MLDLKRPSRRALAIVLLAFALLSAPSLSASPSVRADAPMSAKGVPWKYLENDDGIDVWTQEVPGQDLPGFRGQVIIDASMQHIFDEMMDSKHHTEWMYRMKEARVLKEISSNAAIVYSRTSAPWPVWDRDVILQVGYTYNADRSHLIMRFKNIDSDLRKVPERVIRMPFLSGFYKLWKLGENKTKILYEVEADIGGSIPRWMVKKASKDLPYITLSALRDRVMMRAKQRQ